MGYGFTSLLVADIVLLFLASLILGGLSISQMVTVPTESVTVRIARMLAAFICEFAALGSKVLQTPLICVASLSFIAPHTPVPMYNCSYTAFLPSKHVMHARRVRLGVRQRSAMHKVSLLS
jgi:hypothetical protein